MPVNYGLLRGAVIDAIPYQKGADHYQIEINAAGTLYRIAVDVYSELQGSSKRYSPDPKAVLDTDRMVMYYKDENYAHPVLAGMLQAPEGFTAGASLPQPLLLDYLRYTPALFPLDSMKVVPPKDASGNGEDLNDDIDPWIQQAKNNANAEIFAFGSGWDDGQGGYADPHPYFNPDPSLGVHDIHMNQGDTGSEAKYNGVWQDGALFIRFIGAASAAASPTLASSLAAAAIPSFSGSAASPTPASAAAASAPDKWVAMFFRFQNQSTNTNDKGNPA